MIAYTYQFLTALTVTIAIETALLFCLFKIFCLEVKIEKLVFAGIFATGMTIPYVWFVFPTLLWYSNPTALISAEFFAFFVEAIFYKLFLEIDYQKAFLFSFLCNAASYFLGLIIFKPILDLLNL